MEVVEDVVVVIEDVAEDVEVVERATRAGARADRRAPRCGVPGPAARPPGPPKGGVQGPREPKEAPGAIIGPSGGGTVVVIPTGVCVYKVQCVCSYIGVSVVLFCARDVLGR